MNLRQAIVFSILMQNGEGISGKAPSYIEEKMKSAEVLTKPEVMLDTHNLTKFYGWQKRWQMKFEDKAE